MPNRTEPKEPLALAVKGRVPETIVAWACGMCGIVARDEQRARECCDPRCAGGCGARVEIGNRRCDACDRKRRAEFEAVEEAREKARYEKAQKVKYGQHDSVWLYWPRADCGGGGEGYFHDVGELFDRCADEGWDPPDWVWACSPVKMAMNADDLISRACEEMYEDAEGDIPKSARKILQEFLDVWCERHSPTSYTPNYAVAVDISAESAAWRAEQELEDTASRTP